ncbi:MAG: exo-alpha-sialidase [Clostridia bacterium]|nr:exo-alpha-sialidase [Clostridia bacterium]
MTFETLTPNGAVITAPDMRGKMSEPFTAFAVRGPGFVELKDGTLLYFFGMKFGSQLDEALGCSALMRSHDGGKTWGEMRLLRYDGAPFDVGGGVPVYDEVHDTLLLFARTRHWKPGYEEDRLLAEGDQLKGHTYERFWITRSTDGGLTWSDYKEVIIEGIPERWTVQNNLIGHGIQLKNQKDQKKNGRLIMPCNRAELKAGEVDYQNGGNEFRAHLILSDDFGETWRVGALEDYLGANESVIVELLDGTLVYNCRNQGGTPENRRIQSISHDGGETLEGSATVDSLYDPICHAGYTTTVIDGKEYIFFTAPSGELGNRSKAFGTPQCWGRREALLLYASVDGGKTYKVIKQVSEKGVFAAYSAILPTKGGKLLCAWESGPEIGLYRDIRYTTYELSELAELCK